MDVGHRGSTKASGETDSGPQLGLGPQSHTLLQILSFLICKGSLGGRVLQQLHTWDAVKTKCNDDEGTGSQRALWEQ